ncbi:MAG: hypothetical protein VX370_00195 [Bacteroidota bacterium]|nr:hypothetical protein [Bacteroidota bacterium]
MKKIVESIGLKVKKVIILYEDLKRKGEKLALENKELEEKVSDYEIQLKKLQEDLQILKISKSVNASQEELKSNRQKINKYVREIDRCIELLNK